jgi:hypothetical protein
MSMTLSEYLLYYIGNKDENKVKELLSRPEVNPNETFQGHLPLVRAILKDNQIIVAALINHPQIDPNLRGRKRGRPIHTAITTGNITSFKMLLMHPLTNIHEQDDWKCGLLHYATQWKKYAMIEVLLILNFHEECFANRWVRNGIKWDYERFMQIIRQRIDLWRQELTLQQRCWLVCIESRIDYRNLLPRYIKDGVVSWFMNLNTGIEYKCGRYGGMKVYVAGKDYSFFS